MKKIMGLLLGLSLVLGTASAFAQDTGSASTDATTGKAKKHKKSKKSKTSGGAMGSDTSSTSGTK